MMLPKEKEKKIFLPQKEKKNLKKMSLLTGLIILNFIKHSSPFPKHGIYLKMIGFNYT